MSRKVKKQTQSENYLDFVPMKAEAYSVRVQSLQTEELAKINNGGWYIDENGLVTLLIENRGFMNRVAQKLLKKPRITQIHMEKFGSFIWQEIDNRKSIYEIGQKIEQEFGEEANPLYERLIQYMRILENHKFISVEKTLVSTGNKE